MSLRSSRGYESGVENILLGFPSPLEIRVPFFLLFGFNKGTQKEKGQKGPTGRPSF